MNQRTRAVEAANNLLDFVNAFGCDEETFAETICTAHKTLQQSVMRLFMTTIRKLAEVRPDARNEATVELAGIISEIAESYKLPLI